MIKVLRSRFLTFYSDKFKCSIGKNGITKNKIEGDLKTPKGIYRIIQCFYRSDRVKIIKSKLKFIPITKNMGWCDDPSSKNYNQLIKLPNKFSHEKFFIKENIYDVILVLNYNMNPTIKNKGSAIFIHIANKNYKPTKGCIALKKKDLIKILKRINTKTQIQIK